MPSSLHSNKIKDEKNAFVEELYKVFPEKDKLVSGAWNSKATQIHKYYLALYIMNFQKPKSLKTKYFNYLMTAAIESEALFLGGFKNAAFMQLRCAMEATFKLLYYETHPVEWELHKSKGFDLTGLEYREFLYMHPKFAHLNILKYDIERNWGELCQYSHYDISIVNDITCVIDIKNIMSDNAGFEDSMKKIKSTIREMVFIFFMIDSRWLEGIEKAYFDYIFEILYSKAERITLIDKLGIV